jgi:hypothetical protein
MSHTPGPWLQSSTMLVCSGQARVIANCTPMVDIPELAIPLREVEANARLIAAAPDLLAALEGVELLLDSVTCPEECNYREDDGLCGSSLCAQSGCTKWKLDDARAAIKKAKE